MSDSEGSPARLSVLTDAERTRIFEAALEVLERAGAWFHDADAVATFRKAGCTVAEDNRVRFPAKVVRRALASAPSGFTLYTRTGEPAIEVTLNRAHFGPGPTCCNFIDPDTGERRLFTKSDAALTARVCDALPNIDYVMSLGSISDVGQDVADVHEFDAMCRETTKPIMSWSFSRKSLACIHEMCAAIRGSHQAYAREPFMIFYAEPNSPLRHSPEAVQKLMYCAEHGVPLVYTPCPIGGATAPATLAGVLVQNLAETLGGVVLSQLVREGTPIVVGGVVSILDMQTTILAYGAPELSLLSAGATEVARHLGLPMFSTAGCTDSKCLDEQAAAEAAVSIAMAALSGASFVHDVGYTESGMTGSLPQLVLGDELIGMARHIARGIAVDDDTLAVDTICQAAASADFLSLRHTFDSFRKQFWFPGLMDRSRWGEWADAGRVTMGDRIRERVRRIIATHRAEPLDGAASDRLDDLVAGTEKG